MLFPVGRQFDVNQRIVVHIHGKETLGPIQIRQTLEQTVRLGIAQTSIVAHDGTVQIARQKFSLTFTQFIK